MDKHIAKETELNAYSQVDRLDDATLTFAFGQLSQAQEQIKAAAREFIRECATEIRTETDSRNSRLVEKIIDKHNRLIEVMLTILTLPTDCPWSSAGHDLFSRFSP